jgi:hypothetical protein
VKFVIGKKQKAIGGCLGVDEGQGDDEDMMITMFLILFG